MIVCAQPCRKLIVTLYGNALLMPASVRVVMAGHTGKDNK